jgi:hypothetical protein
MPVHVRQFAECATVRELFRLTSLAATEGVSLQVAPLQHVPVVSVADYDGLTMDNRAQPTADMVAAGGLTLFPDLVDPSVFPFGFGLELPFTLAARQTGRTLTFTLAVVGRNMGLDVVLHLLPNMEASAATFCGLMSTGWGPAITAALAVGVL